MGCPEIDSLEESLASVTPRLTAKGTVRVRNEKWSQEERFALLYNILHFEDDLKARGKGSAEVKTSAWQNVLGEKLDLLPFFFIYNSFCFMCSLITLKVCKDYNGYYTFNILPTYDFHQ